MLVPPDSFSVDNFEVYLKEIFPGTFHLNSSLIPAFDEEISFINGVNISENSRAKLFKLCTKTHLDMTSTKQESNTTLKFRSDPWTPTGYYSHLLPPHKVGKFDEVCKKIRNTPENSEKMNKLCRILMSFKKYELHEPKPKR